MKKILVTGSNGYIGNALVLALLNRKKEFTVRAAARRGPILNSNSFSQKFRSDEPKFGDKFLEIDRKSVV